MKKVEYLVIGAGPGGYVSAIRAAQLGMKVCCIEKRSVLGGTCLNEGCIPSKSLLHTSDLYSQMSRKSAEYGIIAKQISLDFEKMHKTKNDSINELRSGIESLFKKNKIERIEGEAKFKKDKIIDIMKDNKVIETIEAKNIIIATGSKVASLPNINIDNKIVIDSTDALSLKKPPKKMLIIGAGVIGIELGTVWSRLGSDVTIVEYMNKIIPNMDSELCSHLEKECKEKSIKILLSHKVIEIIASKNSAEVIWENENKEREKNKFNTVLVCVGRKPNTDNLGLNNTSIKLTNSGQIITNENLETNVSGVFAIGDVTTGPMLAHKASEEGVCVAEFIAGQKPQINYELIPSVVYTNPEIASVGKTEEELKKENIDYKKGISQFKYNSRAKATLDTCGFVKVLACKKTDKILGMHISHSHAATMIGEACVAMEYQASTGDIGLICHSHPDYNEAIREACLAAFSKPIHG